MATPTADPGLHRKLVWLNVFRLATVTVLLGGTAVMSWQLRRQHGDVGVLAPLYLVVIGTYALTIAFALALRRRVAMGLVAYGQIAVDVAIAAVVGSMTGGADSVFLFMFSLAVVNGAILLYRRGALIACLLAIAGYLAMVQGADAPAPRALTIFVHCTAFVLTGVLASYLAEQLRTTGERLEAITGLHESIVQSMTSGLATLDPAGRVTFLNPTGEAMAGLTLAEIRGRPAATVFPAFRAATGRGEVEHVNGAGPRMLRGYSSVPLAGPRGAPLGTAIIFQDLTRLRAMEEAVARSERLADLGMVAAGLAHELRNPLAAISGSVELLRAQAAPDGEDHRLMDIVLKEAARLDRLVTEFLHFARPPPVVREPVDLAALLAETLDVFAHDPSAAGIAVARDLRAAAVSADPAQLRQVAWNLLLNAAQALRERGEGGHIRVTSRTLSDDSAAFAVEDDGPGIPPADLERIFLPFHTSKARGSGLGLANVHRVVDAHGGRITVESTPGSGARFTVWLPAAAEQVATPAPQGVAHAS
jgi:two-component system sensor histidine kinase PilS (NtrC family)